ncbi:NAD(P)-binding domain-containing protein [Kitasatospora xanthocidica]|uniref:NAD(P)-binding domain-containing protein n=1 Tax=Kitasatospora xanthocidica TaxID=83382 RepID=UPI0036E5EC82
MPVTGDVPVTVIGAGPYGLAVAAHLSRRGTAFRVLGEPMDSWRERMPAGMYLKSTPRASSISDPGRRHRLEDFRTQEGRPPGGDREPVPIEEFIRYGEWFQRRCVPQLERTAVRAVAADGRRFRIRLADGTEFGTAAVVLATGLGPYQYVPVEFAGLAADGLLSHTADHHDLARFAGRRVAVVGAGQSALESAALLAEAGAEPTVVARTRHLLFGEPPDTDLPAERPLPERIVKPGSTLGPGWSLSAFATVPWAFRHLPDRTRLRLVRDVLGPSGAWWLRDRVEGRFALLAGHRIERIQPTDGGVRLELHGPPGGTRVLDVDHVLAATGYRVDVDRLALLGPELRLAVRRVAGSPRLTSGFESSVPGLYFTGLSAAATFGPLLRFVAGTGFAAGRLGAALAGSARGRAVPVRASAGAGAGAAPTDPTTLGPNTAAGQNTAAGPDTTPARD